MSAFNIMLVLHAHLPYVRQPEEGLEERWFYEAMAETYIPLLWLLENGSGKGKWCLSFSPPLMEMMADSLMQDRFLHYLDNLLELAGKEARSTLKEQEIRLANFYIGRLNRVKETFLAWDQNILKGFRHFYKEGRLECITASASHSFLPYLATGDGIRAQIREGLNCFQSHFGVRPDGFWLPECAYSPEVGKILKEEGISYTFVDEHAIKNEDHFYHMPAVSPEGIILFPRSRALSNKVWCSKTGYPGSPEYREFYRDIGYERDWDFIKTHVLGVRHDTGLKYWRITGSEAKDYYCPAQANAQAKVHAVDFIKEITQDGLTLKESRSLHRIAVLPFDAELFGHWWFEGPVWLEYLLSSSQSSNLHFIAPSDYIQKNKKEIQIKDAEFSSWGRNGYGETWLNGRNAWIYKILHSMEKTVFDFAKRYRSGSGLTKRAINQMYREWLLASASDWAFMLDNGHFGNYAKGRITFHLDRFEEIKRLLAAKSLSETCLEEIETRLPFLLKGNIFSFIKGDGSKAEYPGQDYGLRILMLTWEYPPHIVGGLARHVSGLSKALARAGHHVTVITASEGTLKDFEMVDGVHIHRVSGLRPFAGNFLEWVAGLNISMYDKAVELSNEGPFDIVHAHDWLVGDAGIMLGQIWNTSLAATIHATEQGRSMGAPKNSQLKIIEKERSLISKADFVIVCSQSMKEEVAGQYNCPEKKISVLPNGADAAADSFMEQKISANIGAYSHLIFSMGRMVREKGYDTLLEGFVKILPRFPSAKLVIAGKGPLLESYRRKVLELGLADVIYFIGFINDEQRNYLLRISSFAVYPSLYEPFGLAALETLAFGKAVVVSRIGGLGSLVKHGEIGLQAEPGNPESLAEQMAVLLNNPGLAAKLGTKAQSEILSQYNWDNIADKTAAVYQGNSNFNNGFFTEERLIRP